MSKTVLITGGAGFIGSHVVDRLINRGDTVIVLDDFNDYYSPDQKYQNIQPHLDNPHFSLVKADIRARNVFSDIFSVHKIDTVVHLAARAGVRPSLENPQLYWEVNTTATLNLLEAMKVHEVPHLVFAGSSSVYGNRSDGNAFSETDRTDMPVSPYAASKKAAEVLIASYSHLYNLKATVLRFFNAYGPRNRPDMAPLIFTKAALEETPIDMFGDGNTGRDYTYVEDIADAVVLAVDTPFKYEIINLGNSSPVLLKDLIQTVEQVTGKKLHINRKPARPGDVEFTFANNSKAKELLGWQPTTKLKEGLKKLLEWHVDRSKK